MNPGLRHFRRYAAAMGRWTTIDVDGDPMRAWVATPEGGGEAPGVLVVMHGPGLDEFIQDRVDVLARHGYAALAPDLFFRQPDLGSATIQQKMEALTDDVICRAADAAVVHLHGLTEVTMGALGVIGFCMGGRGAYLLAGARPETWRAAGVFYGGDLFKPWGGGPSPFEHTAAIGCPLIGFFGQGDTNPSPGDVDTVDAELTARGKPHVFHRYEGAGHAFLNFTSEARYRPAQAADAWAKLLEFLDDKLALPSRKA